jgi:hypothetical protein
VQLISHITTLQHVSYFQDNNGAPIDLATAMDLPHGTTVVCVVAVVAFVGKTIDVQDQDQWGVREVCLADFRFAFNFKHIHLHRLPFAVNYYAIYLFK